MTQFQKAVLLLETKQFKQNEIKQVFPQNKNSLNFFFYQKKRSWAVEEVDDEDDIFLEPPPESF